MNSCRPQFSAVFEMNCNLPLHPEFIAQPTNYAQKHQVNLDPLVEHQVAPRATTGQSKSKNKQQNFYLAGKSMKLEVEFPSDDPTNGFLKTIRIDPSLFIFGNPNYPLNNDTLQTALSITLAQITPLLANHTDAQYIIPGISEKTLPARSFWKKINCEIYWPNIERHCLHHMKHPQLDYAQGSDKKKIKFAKDFGFSVTFESISEKKRQAYPLGSTGEHRDLLVSLTFPERKLAKLNQARIDHNNKEIHMVSFDVNAISTLIRDTMLQFEGTYLPVLEAAPSDVESITDPKVVALVARLTEMPIENCIELYSSCKDVSKRTRERNEQAIRDAYEKYTPIPFQTLCDQMLARADATIQTPPHVHPIDPRIAKAYGDKAGAVFQLVRL